MSGRSSSKDLSENRNVAMPPFLVSSVAHPQYLYYGLKRACLYGLAAIPSLIIRLRIISSALFFLGSVEIRVIASDTSPSVQFVYLSILSRRVWPSLPEWVSTPLDSMSLRWSMHAFSKTMLQLRVGSFERLEMYSYALIHSCLLRVQVLLILSVRRGSRSEGDVLIWLKYIPMSSRGTACGVALLVSVGMCLLPKRQNPRSPNIKMRRRRLRGWVILQAYKEIQSWFSRNKNVLFLFVLTFSLLPLKQ